MIFLCGEVAWFRFKLNPATIIVCLFICEHIVCFLFTFLKTMLSLSLKLEKSTCPGYFKVGIPLVERLCDLYLIYSSNILFVCLFTCVITMLSLYLNLEQSTCPSYFKVGIPVVERLCVFLWGEVIWFRFKLNS